MEESKNETMIEYKKFREILKKYSIKISIRPRMKKSLGNVSFSNLIITFKLNKNIEDYKDIYTYVRYMTKYCINTKLNLVYKVKLKKLYQEIIKLNIEYNDSDYFILQNRILKLYEEKEKKEYKNNINLLEEYIKINNQFELKLDLPNEIYFRKFNGRVFGKFYTKDNKIVIDKRLEEFPRALNFVLYHEMLHKKYHSNIKRRMKFHTKSFKELEKIHPDYQYSKDIMRNLI
ncbi:MAG: hypothetical protein PHT94_02765 [Candidatus Nanoarchaeia archaeon]|nr:hypothetical protein [Candidatus Nanoarchaeia archaeon]